MCRRGKAGLFGGLTIISHNINGLTTVKMQQCRDIATELVPGCCPIFCLQETKIKTIRPPAGLEVLHSPREGCDGGGIVTMLPTGVRVLATSAAEPYVYTQVALADGVALHVVNIYLPPARPTSLWHAVLDLTDTLPTSEPWLLLGDLNAHLGTGWPSDVTCSLHGEKRKELPGGVCQRGRLVPKTLQECGLHILNGCQHA